MHFWYYRHSKLSSRGSRRGSIHGRCGHRGRARGELHEKYSILLTSEIVGTLTVETRSQAELIEDDLVSQAMLRVLKKVARMSPRIGYRAVSFERSWVIQGPHWSHSHCNYHNKCVRFEEGLRFELRILIASQWEQVFVILVDKVKPIEEVKHTAHKRKEQEKAQSRAKREIGFTGTILHPKKRAWPDGPPRVKASVGSSTVVHCDFYGICHLDEC